MECELSGCTCVCVCVCACVCECSIVSPEQILSNTVHYTLGSFTLHFGLKYEVIYQLDAIEYLFVFFQLDMFRAYTPIFRSNGCYNFFTYAAYGVL